MRQQVSEEQFNELMREMRIEERKKIGTGLITTSVCLASIAFIFWTVYTGQVVITITGDVNYICEQQEK